MGLVTFFHPGIQEPCTFSTVELIAMCLSIASPRHDIPKHMCYTLEMDDLLTPGGEY